MASSRARSRLALLAAVAIPAALLVAAPAHAAVPGNDLVANAIEEPLSGDTQSLNFPFASNSGATAGEQADIALSGDEGQAQHTIWYRLEPAPGRILVTVSSASVTHVVAGVVTSPTPDPVDGTDEFDTITDDNVVSTNATAPHLTRVVTNSDTQSFSFTADSQWAAAGHSYYLGIGSVGADATAPTGTISLTVDYFGAPINDDFANALPITSGPALEGDTTGATPELDGGTTDLDPVVSGPSMFSTWFVYTPTANGLATVDTAGSSFDTTLEVCQSFVPSADDCADHSIVTSASDSSAHPKVSFDVVDGFTYYVFLDGQPTALGPNQAGPYAITVSLAPAPTNDDVATPTTLSGKGVVHAKGSNVGAAAVVLGSSPPATASSEASHGLSFNHGARHTVWYRYTPPTTGRLVLTTSGALNTAVEVFTGSLAKGFTDTKAGNDDYATGLTYSRFAWQAQKGTTYTIGVDGSRDAVYPQDSFGLTIGAAPANDDLKHAAYLAKHKKASAASGKVHGSTQFATLQGNEKTLKKQIGVDTWYTFVAPKGGKYHFTESLPKGVPALGVFSGKGKNTLGRKLVSYVLATSTKPVSVAFHAAPGQKFSIEVASTLGSVGKYTLSWR